MAITTSNLTLENSDWTLVDTGVNANDEVSVTAEYGVFFAFGTSAPAVSPNVLLGHHRAGLEEFSAKINAGDKIWIRCDSKLPCRVTISIKRSV